MPEDMKASELLPLVTEVVAAKLSNGKTPSSELAPLIQSVYQVEPPRVCRRLQLLRGWSHGQAAEPTEVFT